MDGQEVVAIVGVLLTARVRVKGGTAAEVGERLRERLVDAEGNWRLDQFSVGEGMVKLAVLEEPAAVVVEIPRTPTALSA